MNRGIAVLAIIVLALFAGIFGCSCSGRKKPAPICRESCVPPITLIFVVLSDNAKEMFPILLPGSFSPNDPGKIMEFWKIIKGEIQWPLQLSHLNQTFLVVSNNGYRIDKVVLAKCFSWWI